MNPIAPEAISLPATITIDVDPVLLRLGHLSVGWYGIVIALAIVVSFVVVRREARRHNLDEDAVMRVTGWAVAGGLLGARALHVADRWQTYASDPLRIFAFQQGGLAIQGALLGGLIAGIIAARRSGVPVWTLADAAAPGVVLGQGIGRLGCLFTGDALGGPTALPWGVVYTNPARMAPQLGVALQPVFAYEALWDLAVFAVLWMLRGRLGKPGRLFATYLGLYAAGKFAITSLRQEPTWAWGLQEAQILAMLLLVIAAGLWLLGPRQSRGTFAAQEGN